MKRSFAQWLLALSTMVVGSWLLYVSCPGCIDGSRANTTCEWTGDRAFPIDPQIQAHREHLAGDAQLAEELAVRYADAEFGRRSGLEHHGGLLEGGRVRNECLARMFRAIESNHNTTSEQVQLARGERNGRFDLAASLLFVPLYLVVASAANRWLSRRFSTDERLAALVATGVASVAVSVLGFQSLRLWLGVWEVIRVGNGHIAGLRAATFTHWSHDHVGAQLIGGVVLFWVIALCSSRLGSAGPAADARRPHGMLLH